MRTVGGLFVGILTLAAAGEAQAQAWNPSKGSGQAILKFEDMRADRGFDPSGVLQPLPAERRDTAVSVFVDYGLTDRLALRFKGDWQSGEDAFVDYDGRGPLEVGISWQAWRDDRTAVSFYGGVAEGGEGRNAGYAPPGVGAQDWEARIAIGRSFGDGRGEEGWLPTGGFVELQAARRMRQGLPDETRVDATVGARIGEDWLVLAQAYGGEADDGGPRWLSVETSVVRDFGEWSVQAGWRQAVYGRETPESAGPVVALWRRF